MKVILNIIGVFLILAGAIFFLQGINIIPGSFMTGMSAGWFDGTVFKIDPYSGHRSFYWVELDADAQAILGIKQISIFNPKNIHRIGQYP